MGRKRKEPAPAEDTGNVLDGVILQQAATQDTWAVQFRFGGKACSKLLYGTKQTASSVRELVAVWLCFKAADQAAVTSELQQLQHSYEHYSFLIEALKHSKSVEALWKVVGKFCRGEFSTIVKPATARASADESTGRSPSAARFVGAGDGAVSSQLADGMAENAAAAHQMEAAAAAAAVAAAAAAAAAGGEGGDLSAAAGVDAAALAAAQLPMVVDPAAAAAAAAAASGLPPGSFPVSASAAAAAALQAALLYARGTESAGMLPMLWQQQFPGMAHMALTTYPSAVLPGQLGYPDSAAMAAAAAAAGMALTSEADIAAAATASMEVHAAAVAAAMAAAEQPQALPEGGGVVAVQQDVAAEAVQPEVACMQHEDATAVIAAAVPPVHEGAQQAQPLPEQAAAQVEPGSGKPAGQPTAVEQQQAGGEDQPPAAEAQHTFIVHAAGEHPASGEQQPATGEQPGPGYQGLAAGEGEAAAPMQQGTAGLLEHEHLPAQQQQQHLQEGQEGAEAAPTAFLDPSSMAWREAAANLQMLPDEMQRQLVAAGGGKALDDSAVQGLLLWWQHTMAGAGGYGAAPGQTQVQAAAAAALPDIPKQE